MYPSHTQVLTRRIFIGPRIPNKKKKKNKREKRRNQEQEIERNKEKGAVKFQNDDDNII